MALIFLNGNGMRGGALHHQLRGAPLVLVGRTAPKYRFHAVGGRFPAMSPAAAGDGRAVVGEVYEVPLEVLRDHLLPAEPPELELDVIELADGTACLATVLRRPHVPPQGLVDLSDLGDWRAYRAQGGSAA